MRLKLDNCRSTHLEVFNHLRAKEIMVNLHYIPVHLQPYYQDKGFKEGDFPEAERYYEEAISIPMHPSLTEDDQDYVVEALREVL